MQQHEAETPNKQSITTSSLHFQSRSASRSVRCWCRECIWRLFPLRCMSEALSQDSARSLTASPLACVSENKTSGNHLCTQRGTETRKESEGHADRFLRETNYPRQARPSCVMTLLQNNVIRTGSGGLRLLRSIPFCAWCGQNVSKQPKNI